MGLTANIMICIFTILGFILLLFTALVVTCVFPNNSCGRWWCQKSSPSSPPAYQIESDVKIINFTTGLNADEAKEWGIKKPKHIQPMSKEYVKTINKGGAPRWPNAVYPTSATIETFT